MSVLNRAWLGVLAGGIVALAGAASATTITATLSDVNGSYNATGFPIDLALGESFTYSIPGSATITSATIGGTFGTAAYPTSTAGFDVVVDGVSEVACVYEAACWTGSDGSYAPFSIALPSSIYSLLLSGGASFDVVQTSDYTVRYGTPTLTITYAVPEASTWIMMILGLGAVGGVARVRRDRAASAA
jgi:hypothetical protein